MSQLTDFKCYVSYGDETLTVEGENAKSLYKTIVGSPREEIQTVSSQGDYVHLVFYNSSEDYLMGNVAITDFYGVYHIFESGVMDFCGSPFISAIYRFRTDASLFQRVMESIGV